MRLIYATSLLIAISGCQTTGDPNHGGLFGWDENKAKQRQQALSKTQQTKQVEIEQLQTQNEALEHQASTNTQTLKQLNNAISMLHDEQTILRTQIQDLFQQNKISKGRLKELEDTHNWLKLEETAEGQVYVEIDQPDLAKAKMQKMEQENKILIQEILLLIGR
ncbi:hypothetical protein ACD631_16300 [Alteromonas macleodii]|uniref:hypothetical protein n=1 Tax=Alteromonas macleodii TaxID=28108 RepID=UPI0020769DEC|nr:hypothetical protein [Alteromonas macleodii]USI27917.1 hypothetical protein NFG60_19780 [Alteromonas macleodii]